MKGTYITDISHLISNGNAKFTKGLKTPFLKLTVISFTLAYNCNSMQHSPLEKLMVARLVKNFHL